MITNVWLYEGEEVTIKEFCGCGSVTNRQSVFSHTETNDEEDYYSIQTYKILLCPGCESVTVVLYHAIGSSGEDERFSQASEPRSYKYTRKVLHGPTKGTPQVVPWAIADVVKQAEAVMSSSFRACVILCRAALEEICSDFLIPSEEQNKKGERYFINLHERLERLVNQEHLDHTLKQVMSGVKNLGNLGAHSSQIAFTKQIKAQDAAGLLDLVHYIIEKLYVQKAREQEASEILERLKQILEPSP